MNLRHGMLLGLVTTCLTLMAHGRTAAEPLAGRNVAVSCVALSEAARPAVRSLQARLEEVLGENQVLVLDEAKAAEMRQGYHLLSDPTAVVTAELLQELRTKYQIDQVLTLFVDGDAHRGLGGYHTATAQAEARLIGAEAGVIAAASEPMGVVGNPGSDAVTEGAARLNALERAMDDTLGKLGLRIAVPAEPRLVRLTLEPCALPDSGEKRALARTVPAEMTALAALEKQTWQREEVTASALSPDGNYAAMAGYVWSQRQGSRRVYGSRLHVLDTRARRTVTVLDVSPLAIPQPHEKRGKAVLGAAFVDGWRFLVAANANEIVFYDLERGRELARLPARLAGPVAFFLVEHGDEKLLVLTHAEGNEAFRFSVAR